MKYFSLNKSYENNKKYYLELTLKFHPDKGGNEEIFKQIKNYWDIYNTIFDNLAWIKTELKIETKIIKIAQPVYIEKKVKIVDEQILNSASSLVKNLNKLFKTVNKE